MRSTVYLSWRGVRIISHYLAVLLSLPSIEQLGTQHDIKVFA